MIIKMRGKNSDSLTKAGVRFPAGVNLHATLLLIGFMLPKGQMFCFLVLSGFRTIIGFPLVF